MKLVFATMNNVLDPADLDWKKGHCVDLCNVDIDNDGGISVRNKTLTGLTFQPVTETFGGRDYYAVNNTVYCTKALGDEEDERYNIIISLDAPITMIKRVDGGLYIGSSQELHYLAGTDPQGEGFRDVWSLPYGVIMGTGLHVKGELLPPGLQLRGMNCCIFATHRGVTIGAPGGNIINLSQNKVSYSYGLTGKAMLREVNGLVHYLFQTAESVAEYNKIPVVTYDTIENPIL